MAEDADLDYHAACLTALEMLGKEHPKAAPRVAQVGAYLERAAKREQQALKYTRRLSGEMQRLANERKALTDRLQRALEHLAYAAGVAAASPGRPHDQLADAFVELKNHEIRGAAGVLFGLWEGSPRAREGSTSVKRSRGSFEFALAEELLVKPAPRLAERLLLIRPGDPTADVEEIRGQVVRGLRNRFEKIDRALLSEAVTADLNRLVEKSLLFLRDLFTAAPPGRLLVPRKGAHFDPDRHEPLFDGRQRTGDLSVECVVFPGYVIGPLDRVVEKARVRLTERLSQ